MTVKKHTRQCITCGETFVVGKRRGDSPRGYYGYYCSEHDDRR